MQWTERISNLGYEMEVNRTKVHVEKETFVTRLFSSYAYFIVYSFIGWIWETVITSVDTGTLQKRGFLDVPLLPIYGFAITLIVMLFYNKDIGIPKLFFGSALITVVMEFTVSWMLEKIFHQVWWDYSQMRFQIQGRVCLIGAIIFGAASVLIVQLIHPRVERLTARFFRQAGSRKACIASLILILLDTAVTSIRLLL